MDYAGGREAPSLVVIAAYDSQDFATLMREGIGVGGKKLGLMNKVARLRYSHFTDAERAAVYKFLRKRIEI